MLEAALVKIRFFCKSILSVSFAACVLAVGTSAPVQAGSCDGVVGGLSSNYDSKRGTGFLAVRAGRSSKSRKKGELFNGDVVELYSRKGKWYEVGTASGLSGWAYHKWIRTTCDPNNP